MPKKIIKQLEVDTTKWQNMDGASVVEKKINSILTSNFIGIESYPNECLNEAKHVIDIPNKSFCPREDIALYIVDMFCTFASVGNSESIIFREIPPKVLTQIYLLLKIK
jgi:hypothetical protein